MGELIALLAGLVILGLWAILSRFTSDAEPDDGGPVNIDLE